eukprot:GHVU01033440.1.p1 GENE.GHVU01033440.1~~GHVU01033440.1.p1  ORF type:complete len:196 (-),score=20.06 GHVU01033440.1:172-759(-)
MLIVYAGGGPDTLERDLGWFRGLLSDVELRPARYLPATRYDRPMETWYHHRPVEDIIRLGCNRSVLLWFLDQGRGHMEGGEEAYLLERGTLWQEIYTCLLRFEVLHEVEARYERDVYWARALYCLFLLCEAGIVTSRTYFWAVLNTSIVNQAGVAPGGLFTLLENEIYRSTVVDLQDMGVLAREPPREEDEEEEE